MGEAFPAPIAGFPMERLIWSWKKLIHCMNAWRELTSGGNWLICCRNPGRHLMQG